MGGFALGLAFLTPPPAMAAATDAGTPEYNGLFAEGLAPRDTPARAPAADGRLLGAQNEPRLEDDDGGAARKKLRQELNRIRQQGAGDTGASSFDPPIPVRKKNGQAAAEVAGTAGEQGRGAFRPAADPQIDRLTGQVLIMNFKGSQPSDPGPKSIRALLQSGLVAGVAFSRDNIQSKVQLKELMKFFWPAGQQNRPYFALHEIGGTSDALPPIKDFEQWPAERDVAAKGDPQYAYSTYRSMGSNLAVLGFNVNFGPVIVAPAEGRDEAASFGANPLQAGVFAKTFILGHLEENVLAVPIVDGSLLSVRVLKTLLVSHPGIPVSSVIASGEGRAPFSAYEGLVRGARFCFAALGADNRGIDAVGDFRRGCDILVLDTGAENPATIREQVALGLSHAIQSGELTWDELNSAAQRARESRLPGQGNGAATAARAP